MFETVTIKSEDGAEISALFIKAVKPSAHSVLFMGLPAMGVKAQYYKPLAKGLSEAGHDVLLCDLRGQGSSNQTVPGVEFGYHDIVTLDIPAYVKTAQMLANGKPIISLGHSLGGQLSLLYAAENPDQLSAVALIASGSVYYRAYKFPQSLKIWIGTQSSVLTSALFGYFPGHKLGFGGKQPKTIIRDWARQGRTGCFKPKGSGFDYESAMTEMRLPLFALSIEGDNFAPHSATDHLVGKASQATLTRVCHKPATDVASQLDHFRWVKYNDAIVTELLRWAKAL